MSLKSTLISFLHLCLGLPGVVFFRCVHQSALCLKKRPVTKNEIYLEEFTVTELTTVLYTVISHSPDDGDGVGLRNVGLYKSLDAAFCLRKRC
jgi:hypothetical protein